MFTKTRLAAGLAAFSLMGLLPAAANAQPVIFARVAPPAPLVIEVTPQPRQGYVWAPGHQQWHGNQYVWVPGQWLRHRPGHQYREARWIERNGQWQMVGGDWARRGPNGDRDGDGIRNSQDRDRDGDGVKNRRDRHPDNARRN